MSSLLTAVKNQDVDIRDIDALLAQNDEGVFERDTYGWMPLHYAVYHNRLDIAKKLIDIGKSKKGLSYLEEKTGELYFSRYFYEGLETPLLLAARCGYTNMFYLLLSSGTPFDVKNQSGKSIEDIIKDNTILKYVFFLFCKLEASEKAFARGESERGLAFLAEVETKFNDKHGESITEVICDVKLKTYRALGEHYAERSEIFFARGEYEVGNRCAEEAIKYFDALVKICDDIKGINYFLNNEEKNKVCDFAKLKCLLVSARCCYEDYYRDSRKTDFTPESGHKHLHEARERYKDALKLCLDIEPRLKNYIEEQIYSIDTIFSEFELNKAIKTDEIERLCDEGNRVYNDSTASLVDMQKALVSYTQAMNKYQQIIKRAGNKKGKLKGQQKILNEMQSRILAITINIAIKKGDSLLIKATQERAKDQPFDALVTLAEANKCYDEALKLDDSLSDVKNAKNKTDKLIKLIHEEIAVEKERNDKIKKRQGSAEGHFDKAKIAMTEKRYEDALLLLNHARREYLGLFEIDHNNREIREIIVKIDLRLHLIKAEKYVIEAQDILAKGFGRLNEANTNLEKANVELKESDSVLQDLDKQYQSAEINDFRNTIDSLRRCVEQAFLNFYLRKSEEKNKEANDYMKSNNYVDAHLCYIESLWACDEVLAIEPDNEQAKNLKKQIEEKAQELKDKHLSITPAAYTDIFEKGVKLIDEKRIPMAINYFSDVIEIAPDFFEAKYNKHLLIGMHKENTVRSNRLLRDDTYTKPSPYEYASMCEHTYDTDILLSKLAEWKILCRSDDEVLSQDDLIDEGFLGISYINDRKKQIVIAYRGTDTGVFSNFTQISLENFLFNLKADAVLFAESKDRIFALANAFFRYIDDLKRSHYSDYQLSFTGHSLGAALAEVMAIENGINAVTFESPGAVELISADLLNHWKGISEKATFQVVSYMAEPNLINTANTHLAKVLPDICKQVRIFPLVYVLKRELMLGEDVINSILKEVEQQLNTTVVPRLTSSSIGRNFIKRMIEERKGYGKFIAHMASHSDFVVRRYVHPEMEPYKRDLLEKIGYWLIGVNYLLGRTMTTHSMHNIFKFFKNLEEHHFPVLQEEMHTWPKGRLAVMRYYQLVEKNPDRYALPLSFSQPHPRRHADEYMLKHICSYQRKDDNWRRVTVNGAVFFKSGNDAAHLVDHDKLEDRKHVKAKL